MDNTETTLRRTLDQCSSNMNLIRKIDLCKKKVNDYISALNPVDSIVDVAKNEQEKRKKNVSEKLATNVSNIELLESLRALRETETTASKTDAIQQIVAEETQESNIPDITSEELDRIHAGLQWSEFQRRVETFLDAPINIP